MRKEFLKSLVALAHKDPRILLLTADLGFMVLEPFADQFPDRFFNVGVAEQNMVGMSTGLAEAGFIPFLYTMSTFASMRAYEFIRNGPILHRLKVRLIGVGAGVDYGSAGMTHHSLEDVGILRLQPGLTVIVPADGDQTSNAVMASYDCDGPVYYRIGKDSVECVPGLQGRFNINCAETIRSGEDFLIITMGELAHEAVKAAAILSSQNIECTILVVSCMNPAPKLDIFNHLQSFPQVMTVESHYSTGGLGSLVCEIAAENNINCRVIRRGIDSVAPETTGSKTYLLGLYGLTAPQLADQILHSLQPAS